MDLETIRRVCLARQLYDFGISCLKSRNDMQLFAAVNLLQDAVESFLVAVADHVKADIDQHTKFDKYFVAIDARIDPNKLPFKNKLLRLNGIRVQSKHHGIQPARDECERVAVSVREFFDEVSASIFGVEFATVSAIDLLREGEAKELLLEAQGARDSKDYERCVIACRKVLYVTFEWAYSVADFRKDAELKGMRGLLGPYSQAPFYAQKHDYIEQHVKDPTDYIVRDHSRIDQELLVKGVDNAAFWNVWRMTPEVYRDKGEWIVKHEFAKLDAEALAETVDYIFPTTVDLALAVQAAEQAAQVNLRLTKYTLTLAKEGATVYEKADKKSRATGVTPAGQLSMPTDFHVAGLNGDGPYWHVSEFVNGRFLRGYIHNDDVA